MCCWIQPFSFHPQLLYRVQLLDLEPHGRNVEYNGGDYVRKVFDGGCHLFADHVPHLGHERLFQLWEVRILCPKDFAPTVE